MADAVARAIRRDDLGTIPNDTARRLLLECAPAVEAVIRRFRGALAYAGMELDDLRSIAQLAVLEAHLSYEAGRGRTERSWAGWIIRCRVVEALNLSAQSAHVPEDLHTDPVEWATPEVVFEDAEGAAWLRAEVGKLDPREAYVVSRRLAGETYEAIGASLGLTAAMVCMVYQQATRTLQLRLRAP